MPFNRFHKFAFIIAILLYVAVAWIANGYYHADEQFQIIEFAGLKSGFNEANDLAWEYKAGIRPSLQPTIAYATIKFLDFFTSNPYLQSFILRFLTGLMALFAIRRFIMVTQNQFEGIYKKIYVLTSYFLWFLPLIFTRFSSEAWSGIFLLFAMTEILNRPLKSTIPYLKVGVFLGLAFLFRYQSALVSIGIILWLLFIDKQKLSTLFKTGLLILGFIGIGILIDSWFYDEFTITAWNYFDYNILQDVASTFGTKPILWYFYSIIKFSFLPIGVLIGLAFLYTLIEKPKSIYLWAFLPLFIVHSLIPHKEIRFLFPVVFLVAPILTLFISNALTNIKSLYKASFKLITGTTIVIVFIAVTTNFIGLTVIMSKTAGESLIHTGNYIYTNYNKGTVVLYQTPSGSPYKPFGVPLNFYKQENVTTINIASICVLSEDFEVSENLNLISFSEKDLPDFSCFDNHSTLEFERLTQSWPDWLIALNNLYPVYEEPEQAYLYEIKLKR